MMFKNKYLHCTQCEKTTAHTYIVNDSGNGIKAYKCWECHQLNYKG